MGNNEIECNVCGNKYADSYFKNKENNEIICEDCLLDAFCTTSTTTHYFFQDGDYLGSDEDLDEVIENLCDNTDFKEIKGEKE